jgi:hypothetical protein
MKAFIDFLSMEEKFDNHLVDGWKKRKTKKVLTLETAYKTVTWKWACSNGHRPLLCAQKTN